MRRILTFTLICVVISSILTIIVLINMVIYNFSHQGLEQECKPSQLLPFDFFESPPPPPAGLKGSAQSTKERLLQGLQIGFCFRWEDMKSTLSTMLKLYFAN